MYFTIDPLDGARVAIKVARATEWSRKRMKREIEIQRSLKHPNILPIRDYDDDLAWYATDEAECSLDGLGPFPRKQWMHFRAGMLGVASAVGYAHRRGLIHRDLSPGNVLVFAGGWTVSDWGFVRAPAKSKVPRITEPLERFGTPDFMAPEQAADPRNVGPSADIYAIGRIAAWGTMLTRGERRLDDHPFTAWWRLLIDGTTAYDPQRRWTMSDVETYLRSRPAEHMQEQLPGIDVPHSASRDDACPNCLSDAGQDSAAHCLRCHAHMPD